MKYAVECSVLWSTVAYSELWSTNYCEVLHTVEYLLMWSTVYYGVLYTVEYSLLWSNQYLGVFNTIENYLPINVSVYTYIM